MCVYSMIADSWIDRLTPMVSPSPPLPPPVFVPVPLPMPTPSILDDFKFLEEQLRKAAEYDKKNGEPECENEQKIQKLKELARELGVELVFPETKREDVSN